MELVFPIRCVIFEVTIIYSKMNRDVWNDSLWDIHTIGRFSGMKLRFLLNFLSSEFCHTRYIDSDLTCVLLKLYSGYFYINEVLDKQSKAFHSFICIPPLSFWWRRKFADRFLSCSTSTLIRFQHTYRFHCLVRCQGSFLIHLLSHLAATPAILIC